MICIFKGRPTPDGKFADLNAGELQQRLHARFKTPAGECFCEHSNQRNTKTARLEVVTRKQLKVRLTPFERRLLEQMPSLMGDDLLETRVVQEIADLSSPQEIMLSPALQLLGLAVSDLPEGSYGNGLTCNYVVPIRQFAWGANETRIGALQKAENLSKEAEAQDFSVRIEWGISKPFISSMQAEEGHYIVNLRLSWWCVAPVHARAVKDNWLEVCDLMEK